jgi:20S proteasome alpha/beta subunit
MSFLKQGYRKDKLQNDKKVKAHLKAFYKIMDDMQALADKVDLSIEYNEDNINDYLDYRDLDPMEKFLVLGKINDRKNDNNN